MPSFLRWNKDRSGGSSNDDPSSAPRRSVIGSLISRAGPLPSSASSYTTSGRRRRQQNNRRQGRRTSKSSQGSLSIPSTAYSSDEFSLPPSVASFPRSLRRSTRRKGNAGLSSERRPQHAAQRAQQPRHALAATSTAAAATDPHHCIPRLCSSIPILADDSHRYTLHRKGSEFESSHMTLPDNHSVSAAAHPLELTSKTNPSVMATMFRLPNIDDVFTIQDTMENEDAASSASVIVFRQIHSPIYVANGVASANSTGSALSIPSYRYKVYAVRPLWQGQSTSSRYPNFYFWGHVVVTTETGVGSTATSIVEEDQRSTGSSSGASSGTSSSDAAINASESILPIGSVCTKVVWMLHEVGVPESRVRDPRQVTTQYTAKQHYQHIHTLRTSPGVTGSHASSPSHGHPAMLRRRKTRWTTIQKEQQNVESSAAFGTNKTAMTCARIVHCPHEPSVLGATATSNIDNASASTATASSSRSPYRELVVRPGHDAGLVLCFVGILDDLERLQV